MKIFALYHSPCLDGAYSILTLFLFLKIIVINSKNIEEAFLYIFESFCNFFDKKQNLCKIFEELIIDKEKMFEILYNQEFSNDVLFYAVKPSKNNENFFQVFKKIQSKTKKNEEVLVILLDYFAENEKNIVLLSEFSHKLIIIDHHQSFFDICQNESFSYLKNVFFYGNMTRSAAPLTYEYCVHVFGNILPKFIEEWLLDLLKYVEDHDLRNKKYSETDPIISELYSLITDLNCFTNPKLFTSLMKYPPNILAQLGEPLVKKRQQEIIKALKNKQPFEIKLSQQNIIRGFLCEIKDHMLINDVGEELANLSLLQGWNNIGIILKNQDEGFRICIRGNNKVEESPCLIVAKAIGGGGHKYAAGGWAPIKVVKKWII